MSNENKISTYDYLISLSKNERDSLLRKIIDNEESNEYFEKFVTNIVGILGYLPFNTTTCIPVRDLETLLKRAFSEGILYQELSYKKDLENYV